MKLVRAFGVTALCLAAAACGSTAQLDKLKDTDIGRDDFTDYLAVEYRDLAQSERDQYDWIDQQVWAKKGLKAARGDLVNPEMPDDWDIPRDERKPLTEARRKLMKALRDNGRKEAPAEAATAQVMYDCWVEQLEEGWQTEDIAACRDDFFAALEMLRGEMREDKQKAEKDMVLPSKLVFFAFDSAELKPSAEKVIKQMAKKADELDYEVIDCVGHADRAGPADYNMALSLRRADAVAEALMEAGAPEDMVAVSARGEEEPLVPTDDGVPEPQNRRVRIRFR